MTPADADDFTGELILRGDAGFESARVHRIFNRRLTGRQPAAALRAADERDVVLGVRLARARGWTVAVRSGGHSWAHWSIRDDALVIDLGDLQEMAARRDPDGLFAGYLAGPGGARNANHWQDGYGSPGASTSPTSSSRANSH